MSCLERRIATAFPAAAFLTGACDGHKGESLVGTYDCEVEGESRRDVLQVREDGMATLTWGAGADVRDQEGPWEFDPDSGIGTITFTEYGQSFSYEEDRITFQGQGGPKPYVCIRAT